MITVKMPWNCFDRRFFFLNKNDAEIPPTEDVQKLLGCTVL